MSAQQITAEINDPGGYSAQFAYAPDRSRWRQVSSYAGGTETTHYVGGLLEKLTTPSRTHWKHRIATPSGEVQVVRRSDGTSEVLYVTTDQLGSTEAVLGAGGTVLLRGSFDLHGTRRAANWQGSPSSAEWQAIANTTRRGFTGHEMLDNVMLIHMNGRVFDPTIGRFVSADPYIDCPNYTQGWNRYAYVKGRLLSATDPTGFALEQIFVIGRRAARIDFSNGWTSVVSGSTSPPAPAGIGGAVAPPASDKKKSGQNCEGTCSLIGAASLAIGSAIAGGANGVMTGSRAGTPVAIVGGILGFVGGGVLGYVAGSRTGPWEQMADGFALGAATGFPKMYSGGLAGASAGAYAASAMADAGFSDSASTPLAGAVGGAAAGALSNVNTGRTVLQQLRNVISGAKSGGWVGLTAGAVTVAVSELLQATTGCNCGS